VTFFWAKKNCRTRAEEWDGALSWRKKIRAMEKIGLACYIFLMRRSMTPWLIVFGIYSSFTNFLFTTPCWSKKDQYYLDAKFLKSQFFFNLGVFSPTYSASLTLRWRIGEASSFVSRNYSFYRDTLFLHNHFAICDTLNIVFTNHSVSTSNDIQSWNFTLRSLRDTKYWLKYGSSIGR